MSGLGLKPKPFAPEPMKTHTPGPWHLGMRPGLIYGPLGEQIADMRGLTLEKYESIANAHLIASAPDLLAALERLAHPMADDEDLDYAREVIARAKGQQ